MNKKQIEKEINEVLKKIESNHCGKYKLQNVRIYDKNILIWLKEVIGIIENSNEFYLRNKILQEFITKFSKKKNIKIFIN